MPTRSGFTIVELLLVILILGIVAMTVGPATHGVLLEARLNGAAAEVVGALEYAKNCAVRYQRSFAVGWIPQLRVVAVCDRRFASDSAAHLDADPPVSAFGVLFNPFDKKPYTIPVEGWNRARGVRMTLPPEDLLFVFYPEGHVSALSTSITIALGDQQRTIAVSSSTGRVVVQ